MQHVNIVIKKKNKGIKTRFWPHRALQSGNNAGHTLTPALLGFDPVYSFCPKLHYIKFLNHHKSFFQGSGAMRQFPVEDFKALNQYEAVVLKMVYCFEAFDTVRMVISAG